MKLTRNKGHQRRVRHKRLAGPYQHIQAVECFYCGALAEVKDHFIPVSRAADEFLRTGYRINSRLKVTIPACFECNAIAGDKVFRSFIEKQEFIKSQLLKRYRKHLETPEQEWTKKELENLGCNLRKMVQEKIAFAKWIRARLRYAKHADLPSNQNATGSGSAPQSAATTSTVARSRKRSPPTETQPDEPH